MNNKIKVESLIMSIKRNLRFGNTEEMFQFCPEEILYMQPVNGAEETTVFLVNGDYYFLPNGLGYVSKVIDDTLLRSRGTGNSLCRNRPKAKVEPEMDHFSFHSEYYIF